MLFRSAGALQISCTGAGGESEFLINLGTETGVAGISYDSKNMPDNYVIEWNGQVFTTGYVGPNSFDQELINSGVAPGQIKTANPTNGIGRLTFDKNTQMPNTAILRVISPLESADWEFTTICPEPTNGSLAYISEGGCNQDPQELVQVYFDTLDINTFNPSNGDVVYADSALTTPYDGGGKTYRYRISPSGTWQSFSFDISETGVVSNYTNCIIGGGGSIVVSDIILTACRSCFKFKVLVPSGQTRHVTMTSIFNGGGLYAVEECFDVFTHKTSDFEETISSDTNYGFGIDGDNRNLTTGNTFSSTVIVTVRDSAGGNVLDTETFGRIHSNKKCFNVPDLL